MCSESPTGGHCPLESPAAIARVFCRCSKFSYGQIWTIWFSTPLSAWKKPPSREYFSRTGIASSNSFSTVRNDPIFRVYVRMS